MIRFKIFVSIFLLAVAINCLAENANKEKAKPDKRVSAVGFIQIQTEKIQEQNNVLTPEEKKEGWTLLFDGHSTKNWRGINMKSFPQKGWKVEDGAIVSTGTNIAESSDGGDIITQKEYGNFILKV